MSGSLDAFIVKKYDDAPAAAPATAQPSSTSAPPAGPAPAAAPQSDPLAAYTVNSYDAAPAAAVAPAAPTNPDALPNGQSRQITPEEAHNFGLTAGASTTLTPQGLTNLYYSAPNKPLGGDVNVSSSTPALTPPPAAATQTPPSPSPAAPGGGTAGAGAPGVPAAGVTGPPPSQQPAPSPQNPLPPAVHPAMAQVPAASGPLPPPSASGQAVNASPSSPQPAPPSNPSLQGQATTGNVARALGDGLLMGFGDELTAGVRSLMGENYASALQDERAKLAAYQQAHPGQAMTAQIVGGLAPLALSFVAPELAPAAVSRLVPQAARTALAPLASSMLGRAAATGAAAGAVSGFGHGEGGLGNRLTSAAIGAPEGAAFGVAGSAVGAAAGKLLTPNSSGMGLWAQQLAAGHVDPETVLQSAQSARAAADASATRLPGAPPDPLAPPAMTAGETLGDPVSNGLMDAQSNSPGPGMRMAQGIAAERTDRTPITDALTGTFGKRQSGLETEMRLYAERSANGKNDYDNAIYGVGTAKDKDTIQRMLKNVPGHYLSEGHELSTARNDAYNIHYGRDKDGNLVKTKVPSALYLHHTLSALNSASRARGAGGVRTPDAAAALHLAKPIRKYLDNLTGGRYGIAAANFAKHSRRIEAVNAGMDAMKSSTHVEHINRDLTDKFISPDDRDAYATGVLQAVRNQLRTMRSVGNASEKIFGQEFKQENLRAAMRSIHQDPAVADERYHKLAAFLEAHNKAYRTAQGWVGNSKTAVRSAVSKALDEHAHKGLLQRIGHGIGGHGVGPLVALEAAEHLGLSGVHALATVPAYIAVTKGAKALASRSAHKSQDRIAHMLFERDPKKVANTLESLHARMTGTPHGIGGLLQTTGGTAGSLIGGLASGRGARK